MAGDGAGCNWGRVQGMAGGRYRVWQGTVQGVVWQGTVQGVAG